MRGAALRKKERRVDFSGEPPYKLDLCRIERVKHTFGSTASTCCNQHSPAMLAIWRRIPGRDISEDLELVLHAPLSIAGLLNTT